MLFNQLDIAIATDSEIALAQYTINHVTTRNIKIVSRIDRIVSLSKTHSFTRVLVSTQEAMTPSRLKKIA